MEQHSHNKEEHPPMHTVEHLLNGAVSHKLGIPRAYTTHIERKKSKIDFHYDRNLSQDEISELETEVNAALKSGCKITDEYLSYEKAKTKYDLSRIPEEERDKDIRIVHIGEFDSCPCIGTHLGSTDECEGVLKIISSDFSTETKTLRIRFKIIK